MRGNICCWGNTSYHVGTTQARPANRATYYPTFRGFPRSGRRGAVVPKAVARVVVALSQPPALRGPGSHGDRPGAFPSAPPHASLGV